MCKKFIVKKNHCEVTITFAWRYLTLIHRTVHAKEEALRTSDTDSHFVCNYLMIKAYKLYYKLLTLMHFSQLFFLNRRQRIERNK